MMGLASGMDTDFIIQQTLRMHQFKIDNQMRNKKLIEWRQQSHNTIKDEITSLRQTFLSNLGAKSLMNRNAFNSTIANVSGKNSNLVSVRTNAGSPLGNFNITRVESLAKGAHLTTAAGVSASGNGFATSTRLGEMEFGGGQISFTRNGGTVRVGNEDIKIERQNGSDELTFKNKDGLDVDVNWEGNKVTISAGGTERTLNWNALTNNFTEDRPNIFTASFTGKTTTGDANPRDFTITANLSGSEPVFSSSVGTTTFADGIVTVRVGSGDSAQVYEFEWDPDARTLDSEPIAQATQQVTRLEGEADLIFNTGNGDVSVQIRATDTLSEMMTKINSSAAGVNMRYDRLTDQFTLEAKTGTNIDPESTQLGIYSNSNFFNIIRGSVGAGPIVGNGQKAVMYVGTERIERNTNSFDFRGVSITLHDTFDDEAVSVNLARDTDKAFNAIKDFIDSYNSIIRRLESLLSERKTGSEVSYKPLTDEEKQGMSDKQIEEWEAIARKGIMRNDQGIRNLVSSLRASFFEQIEGAGISPSQIGLSTGSFFDGTGGQIMINEERLREALERDPDQVTDVFIRIDDSSGSVKGVGLLHKIDGLMRDFVNTTQNTSIKNLEDSLKRANEQIQKMQERMFAEEDRLYRVFASMESAMSKLQQQGSWFGAMLGQ